MGVVTVESRAPFGLFRWRTRLEAPLSVLVYPEVHAMERLPLLEGAQGTAARPRRTPMGHEIVSSRQYFPGDPVRDIHWRNTARLGKPMVKEHEDAQDRRAGERQAVASEVPPDRPGRRGGIGEL